MNTMLAATAASAASPDDMNTPYAPRPTKRAGRASFTAPWMTPSTNTLYCALRKAMKTLSVTRLTPMKAVSTMNPAAKAERFADEPQPGDYQRDNHNVQELRRRARWRTPSTSPC